MKISPSHYWPGYFHRVLCFLLFYSREINVSVNLAHCLTRLDAEHLGQRQAVCWSTNLFPAAPRISLFSKTKTVWHILRTAVCWSTNLYPEPRISLFLGLKYKALSDMGARVGQYADQPIYFPHTEVPFFSDYLLFSVYLIFLQYYCIWLIALHCIALHCISMHCLTWFLNI